LHLAIMEKQKDKHLPDPAETKKNQEDRFAQLLEEYEYQKPRRGQVLEGQILEINSDAILLDVGVKRDAIVPARELSQMDDELLNSMTVGDKVPVFIFRPGIGDEELLVSIRRGVQYRDWLRANQDLEENTLLELEVIGQNRGGLLVRYGRLRGFVPNSQIPELKRDMDSQLLIEVKEGMIGTTLLAKPIEVDQRRRKLVFSALVAQEEQRKQRLSELEAGQVLKGRIVNIVDFGIFVDLNGIDGLVHVSELSWEHVQDPKENLQVGQEIEVEILEIDRQEGHVKLSRKTLLPNPWVDVEKKHQPGNLVRVEVVSVTDFGAFIALPEGVQGLIHNSEIGYTSTRNPQEAVKVGDTVLAVVLSVDVKQGRMSLSMRRVPLDDQLDWLIESQFTQENEEGPAALEHEMEVEQLINEDDQPATEESQPEPGQNTEGIEQTKPEAESVQPGSEKTGQATGEAHLEMGQPQEEIEEDNPDQSESRQSEADE
jgi:small subunit ribosomal protein S1